ncbi:MAG: metallophosphoesterase [Planctomycetes bacterium]|nr:metallophosphoesterase [Planctomycetota bacterium]
MTSLLPTALAAAAFAPRGAAQDDEPFPYYNHEPYLQSLTSTSVLIVSQSKLEVVARLQYGLESFSENRIEEESPRYDHLFRLEGLKPDTLYHYRVTHIDQTAFARSTFRTLPEPGSELTVAASGDAGTLSDEQLAIAGLLEKLAPRLLLITGDLVYPYGSPRNYHEKFFEVYEDLLRGTCVYPSLGNHDCWLSPDYWLYAFHTPANNPAGTDAYYSFDAGDAHFVALNTCEGEVPEEQVAWLDQDLAAAQRGWKIVFFHHAPYSNAIHGGTVPVRDAVVPVFERRGVDLVLSGHDHVYERSYPILGGMMRDAFQDPDYVAPRGIIYVVTGGGGAGLYDYFPSPEAHLSAFFRSEHHYVKLRIAPGEIEGTAVSVEGKTLDRFTIRKRGEGASLRFLRGDANEDRDLNLTDGVVVLNYLFTGAPPPCLAASDFDASGTVTISDPIQTFNFLFTGGRPPAPPYPDCGGGAEAPDVGCKGPCAGN